MFCLKTAILNIRRHKQKSVMVVLVCMFVVFFVFIYINSISANQAQYDDLPNALPVTARIVNHNGSQVVGLIIGEEIVNKAANSGYAKDVRYSVRMAANFSSVPNEKDLYKKIAITAVNDIEAVSNFKDRNIKLMDSEDLGFLQRNEAKCIADDYFMQRNGLAVGDSMEINLYCYDYDSSTETFVYVPLGTCNLLIVGSMNSVSGDDGIMDLLCPVGWAKEKHIEAGANFYIDSARFTVADAMKLNAFKAAMKKSFMLPVDPFCEQSVAGDALSVSDETFIKTATRLKNNLTVLYAFAPVVFIVISLVGYAVSYLLMQSRRADIVIMRSLGVSRAASVFIMFLEFALLGFAGAALGFGSSALFMGFSGPISLLIALMFFISFLLGIIVAAFQISRQTAMSGFVKVEA